MSSNRSPRLIANAVTKEYNLRPVLRGVDIDLQCGDVLAVTGRNGSGKSTLIKILANVLEATSGTVEWHIDDGPLKEESLPAHAGLVGPYLTLYTEFSLNEHVELLASLRGVPFDPNTVRELINAVGLSERANDELSEYSSGMLQRARFVCALANSPSFLFLDEPMANLDAEGVDVVRSLILSGRDERVTVIGTNDPDDLDLATAEYSVEAEAAVTA